MDEQLLRTVLAELADTAPSASMPDPGELFARARRVHRRTQRLAVLAATVVVLLIGATLVRFPLLDNRSAPAALPREATLTTPSWQILQLLEPGATPTVKGPYVWMTLPLSVTPLRPPTTSPFVGPYCGWSNDLPATLEAVLPHVGEWGIPQQVAGICPSARGAMIPVTINHRTGYVQVMVANGSPPSNQDEACAGMTHCQQTSRGYLGWTDTSPVTAPGAPANEFSVAATYGLFDGEAISVTAWNDNGNFIFNTGVPDPPALTRPAYDTNALVLAVQALAGRSWPLSVTGGGSPG